MVLFRIAARLIKAELWPEGRMARLACYLAGMAAVLFALEKLLDCCARPGASIWVAGSGS